MVSVKLYKSLTGYSVFNGSITIPWSRERTLDSVPLCFPGVPTPYNILYSMFIEDENLEKGCKARLFIQAEGTINKVRNAVSSF